MTSLRGNARRRLFGNLGHVSALVAVGLGGLAGQGAAQAVDADVSAATPFPTVAPEAVGLDPERLSELLRLTQAWADDGRIVGAELMVIKERQTVMHEVVGWSDLAERRPMERGSVFRVRSMTKPFIGMAALLVVGDGALELQAPVARYLPSWRNPRSGAITVEQLLTHFSGFDQGGTPAPASSYADLRAVVDASGEQGPQNQPGARFIYSDIDTFTLGALVAEVTGIAIEDFVRQRILQPLQLSEIFLSFEPDFSWAPKMNPTYLRDDAGEWERYWAPGEPLTFSWFRASGGMFASALGYAHWLDAWLDPATATGLAHRGAGGLLPSPLAIAALRSHGSDEVAGYGYHWEVWGEDPLVFGHSGSDGTLAVAIPSQQLMLLYFTQSRRSGTTAEWLEAALRATEHSR